MRLGFFSYYLLINLFFLSGCFLFKTTEVSTQSINDRVSQPLTQSLSQPNSVGSSDGVLKKIPTNDKGFFTKPLRESLYFAASLEREALRLITKNKSFNRPTLFSVLSYALEIEAGTKKSAPTGLDCTRFSFEKIKQKINFYKTCEKPRRLMAVLAPTFDQKNLEVEFYTKEWAAVLGLAVALTNPEVKCQISIKESKLQDLTCSHWSFLLEQNQMSSTEVRLQTWQFNRTAKDQFILKGGFFKDLIQSKKIEIRVPLAGQIKLIEKELEVKDDFAAEKLKYDLAQPAETQKEQVAQPQNTTQGESYNEHQKENTSQKKQINKVTFEKKQKEDDYKKWIEQGQNQEQNQNQENQQQLEQQSPAEAIEQNSSEISEQSQNQNEASSFNENQSEVETHAPVPQNFNENQQQPQGQELKSPSDQQSGGVPQLPGRGR